MQSTYGITGVFLGRNNAFITLTGTVNVKDVDDVHRARLVALGLANTHILAKAKQLGIKAVFVGCVLGVCSNRKLASRVESFLRGRTYVERQNAERLGDTGYITRIKRGEMEVRRHIEACKMCGLKAQVCKKLQPAELLDQSALNLVAGTPDIGEVFAPAPMPVGSS